MLQRESDKTTPAIANQDTDMDLGDKQLQVKQGTDKEGKQHVMHKVTAQEDKTSQHTVLERESDKTTPSLANQDTNTDLEAGFLKVVDSLVSSSERSEFLTLERSLPSSLEHSQLDCWECPN